MSIIIQGFSTWGYQCPVVKIQSALKRCKWSCSGFKLTPERKEHPESCLPLCHGLLVSTGVYTVQALKYMWTLQWGKKVSFRVFLMPLNKEKRSKPTSQPHFCLIWLISKGPCYYSNSRRSFNYEICKNPSIIQNCSGGKQWHRYVTKKKKKIRKFANKRWQRQPDRLLLTGNNTPSAQTRWVQVPGEQPPVRGFAFG